MRPLYLVVAYICLLHLGPILNLFALIPGGRVFPITTLGHLLMVYLALRYFTIIRRTGLSHLDLLVTAFLAWSLASFVLYFQKNNPSELSAYAYGVHLYVMPIFGYYAVKTLTLADQHRALKFFLWSNVFLIVVGLYLWWARPDFYTVFLREIVFTNLEHWTDWMIYLRLQSYLSSTALGVLCAITVALAGAAGTSALKTIFVLAAALPAVVLTYQRGGQAGTLLALVYLVVFGKGSRTARAMILGGGIAVATIATVFITSKSDVNLEYYLDRKNDYSASTVMADRSGYVVGMEYVSAFPFGVGLGVGIYSGLRKRKNAGLSCIILIYALVAIGTNVFDGHLTPQLFWLILGMADTPGEVPAMEKAPAPISEEEPDLSLLQPASQKSSPS